MDYNVYDKTYLQELIYNSTSISEVLKKLGKKSNGYYHIEYSKF